MRWDTLRVDGSHTDEPGDSAGSGRPGGTASGGSTAGAAPALFGREAFARTFDTPGFRGMTFYEVHAKTIINQVPPASRMAFRYTINPYRGCSHACSYCFARNTHTYLDLDSGHDFNSKIIVKVNAPDLARRELASPKWQGEHVAMGTNVDCYQRAEGRYKLMPGIISALTDAASPFSILTKGTLILRDMALLQQAAEVTDVGLNVSVGFTDAELARSVEPGTPSPQRRLGICTAFSQRGLRCGVLMGPVLPYLTDSPAQLDATVAQIAQAGAAHITPIVLHLRPGARQWYLSWLQENFPGLPGRYRQLYGAGAYAPKAYQQQIAAQVSELAKRHGVGRAGPAAARRPGRDLPGRPGARRGHRDAPAPQPPQPVQLTLL